MSSYQMIKGFVLEKSYNSDKKMKKKYNSTNNQ